MFVTDDDFNSFPYNIPQSEDAATVLSELISNAEPEILRKVLGSVTYNEFIVGVFVDPNAEELVMKEDVDIDQKWLDLRDGANYSYKGKNYRYDGIKNILKPYIVQEWISDNAENVTLIGVSQPQSENATVVSPGRLISKYYNKFSRLVGNCEQFCDTLWGFIKANEDNYPDWLFTDPQRKNTMGL
jgi:hypothetical protein